MPRCLTSFLLLATLVPLCTRAALTRIDADGVTETGGSPAFSRMIPRTGADGRLSATLLPPVADWASQPLPGLYYLSDGADREGNGSPQYPFRTLTNAWAHATGGSAVLLAPGTYAGAVALPAGQTRTLYGFGAPSAVSALTVTAGGVSPATELRLCGVRVGTLTLYGGTVTVRLCNAVVDVLAGSAAAVTVVRMDLGSSVGTHTLAYTDSYTGYSTVPNARQVVSADGTSHLTVSSGRPHVGTEIGAYLSDLTTATATVYTTIGTLTAEDTRLAGLVATEVVNRSSADAALSQAFSTGITTLSNDVAAIGTGWNTQLSALNGTVSFLGTSLANLWTTETNDVAELQADLLATASNAALANTSLEATLRSEFTSGLTTLRTDVPGLAATAADARILFHSNALVQAAVTAAGAERDAVLVSVTNRITSLESGTAALRRTVATNTLDISRLKGSMASLSNDVTVLRGTVSDNYRTTTNSLRILRADMRTADASVLSTATNVIRTQVTALSNAVPGMARTQADYRISAAKPGIINTAVGRALTNTLDIVSVTSNALAVADWQLSTAFDAVTNEFTTLKQTVTNDVEGLKTWKQQASNALSDLAYTNSAYKGKINEIIIWLRSITNKVDKATAPQILP